jgi:hypothetical protein
MKKLLISILVVITLVSVSPVLAQAPKLDYSGFVKCDGVVKKGVVGEEARNVPCDFNALMDTVIKAINWLFIITIPIATVLFAYGGLLYMTGKSGNIETAKKIFSSAAIGFIIMITAWFVVRTIVNWFVKDTSTANTFLGK